jgi:hypothetical protein
MAISIAQFVDLLVKKLDGVAKTDTAVNKGPSNESIASPALNRGDTCWTQADQIPPSAAATANLITAYQTTAAIQTTADTTTVPIGGIYPTWLTGLTNWIPPEFGSGYTTQAYVGPPGAANIVATGTYISSAGQGGTGEWFFDYQAGLLNFIGNTIPASLTSGNVVYITGYTYVGLEGVTNLPSNSNIGNLTFSGNAITGNLVTITGTGGLVVPSGSTGQRPNPAPTGTLRLNVSLNQLEVWDGSNWLAGNGGGGGGNVTINDQQIVPDGTSVVYALDQDATQASILVSSNGVNQLPGTAYTVAGNVITFAQAPLSSDIIDVRFLASAIQPNRIINTSGNAYVNVSETPDVKINVSGNDVLTATSTGVAIGGFLKMPVYTKSTLTAITGNVGWTASVSDSTPGGRLAFWDTTNTRWSYVSDNTAV